MRERAADQDLHELPRADLGATARSSSRCARASATRRSHRLDQGPRPAGLRVLQPRGARREGRRLRDLPRARRPDEPDLAGAVAADGVVPRLPPPSRALRAPARARCSTWPGRRTRPGGARRASSSQRIRRPHAAPTARRATDERRSTDDSRRPPRASDDAGARSGGASRSSRRRRSSSSSCSTSSRARRPASRRALDRRHFLKLMGASLALAGLGACTRQPEERIVPYVEQPERARARRAALLRHRDAARTASASGSSPRATRGGRPRSRAIPSTRPASGATDAIDAGVDARPLRSRSLADRRVAPGRSARGTRSSRPCGRALAAQTAKQGAGLRILTETVTSPTLARQIRDLLGAYPARRWVQWDPDGARRRARRRTARVRRRWWSRSYRLAGAASSSRSTPTSSAAARGACATRATSSRARRLDARDAAASPLRRRERRRRSPAPSRTIACRMRAVRRRDRAGASARGGRRRARCGAGRAPRRRPRPTRSLATWPRIAARAWSSRATSSRPPSTPSRTP